MPQVKTTTSTTIIHFEDHHQDFLEWHVDNATGKVIECHPFQATYWVGVRVVNLATLEVNGYVIYERIDDYEGAIQRSIKYPIETIDFDLNAAPIGTSNEGEPA